jgi:uncharacterized protein YjbI with pentapeptide repeats
MTKFGLPMTPVRRTQGYVLSGPNLISANLSEADLSGADLLSNVMGLSD